MKKTNHTKRFIEERPQYEKLTSKLHTLLGDLLASEGIETVIEVRTKSVESFDEKVSRPGKDYQNPLDEITDLSGIRLVLRTLSEVNRVRALIEREFIVDAQRSTRKIEHLATDQFGYLSEHYIIQIKKPRSQLPEWRGLIDLYAEIQVRTILQHAWAAVQHSLDYKSEYDIPKQLRRRLFRLSALFELADQELDHISADARSLFAQYAEQVQSDREDIELNTDSLKAYLENSETVANWANFIEKLGVDIGSIGMISRDVEMARMAGLSTIGEVDRVLKTAQEWGEPYLRDFFRNTFGEQIQKGCSMDRNGVVTIFLIGSFLEIFTEEVLESRLGWGKPRRAIVPARQHNPQATHNAT
jgi:putative GTP pyrophosphokinase